jgi:hypothetical protein
MSLGTPVDYATFRLRRDFARTGRLPDDLDPAEVTEPLLPTPWQSLNERLGGGVSVRQISAISANDHHYASDRLRKFHNHLRTNGYKVAWIGCHRESTTEQNLLDWAEDHAEDGADALFIDWFPNLSINGWSFDEYEIEDRYAEGLPATPTDEDVISWMGPRLHTIAARNELAVVLGACMSGARRRTTSNSAVTRQGLRGNGTLEGIVRTLLICWPDDDKPTMTTAWLERRPQDGPSDKFILE